MAKSRIFRIAGVAFDSRIFRVYFLPGFISQSIIIAGGYGTGREIAEYFLIHGTLGGMLGMLFVTTFVWAIVMVATWEFSRVFRAYNYRDLFKNLLGKGWIAFEVLYIALLAIVLGVVGSSAGSALQEYIGIPYLVGTALMLVCVVVLAYYGSEVISRVLAFWSYVFYAVFIAIFVLISLRYDVWSSVTSGDIIGNWAFDGFRYALYNLGCMAGVLFALKSIETRKEAIVSGVISSFITVIPGILIFLSFSPFYPSILPLELPMYYMLENLGAVFIVIWTIVLFGTLIETGICFIHAVNERIESYFRDVKGVEMPRYLRAMVAFLLILLGIFLSTFGLIDLVAKGYGTICWGFLFIYVIPLFVIGTYKIRRAGKHSS